MFPPGRECDLQVDGLHDDRVGCTIEKLEGYQRDWSCVELVFGSEASVDEIVSRAAVNQSLEGMVGNIIGVERYYEGVR